MHALAVYENHVKKSHFTSLVQLKQFLGTLMKSIVHLYSNWNAMIGPIDVLRAN